MRSPRCEGCAGNGVTVIQAQRGRRESESSTGSGEDESGGHDDGGSGGNGEDEMGGSGGEYVLVGGA